MNKLASEKYNILLIVLIFTIPLIALDMSYWLISTINNDWEEKKQKKEAIQEAETLAVEGNFSYELAVHFRDFFKQIQNHAYLDNINNTILTNLLKQSENNIFASPFPTYNLYVFKIFNYQDFSLVEK